MAFDAFSEKRCGIGLHCIHTQAWASMCYLFYVDGQCEKPQIMGRVIIRTPTLFSCIITAFKMCPKAYIIYHTR